MAARPRTLPAALSPVLVGWAISYHLGSWRFVPAVLLLAVGLLLQIAANLVNDVADFQKGTDTSERLGPTRVTQAGLLSPRQVWFGAGITIFLAACAGLALFIMAGWPVLVIGIACIVGCLAYSLGPYSFSRLGVGDLFVLIFFGFTAVGGTVFVLSGSVPPLAWGCALAVGGLTANILVINNLRDINTDRNAGRRTLPVVWGWRAGLLEYAFFQILAYLTITILAGLIKNPWLLLVFLSLPLALSLFDKLSKSQPSRRMNQLLGETGQLLLLFSVLLSLGIILGA